MQADNVIGKSHGLLQFLIRDMKMAGGISSCRQLEQNVSCWYAEALMSKTYDIWSDDGIFSFFFFL